MQKVSDAIHPSPLNENFITSGLEKNGTFFLRVNFFSPYFTDARRMQFFTFIFFSRTDLSKKLKKKKKHKWCKKLQKFRGAIFC